MNELFNELVQINDGGDKIFRGIKVGMWNLISNNNNNKIDIRQFDDLFEHYINIIEQTRSVMLFLLSPEHIP